MSVCQHTIEEPFYTPCIGYILVWLECQIVQVRQEEEEEDTDDCLMRRPLSTVTASSHATAVTLSCIKQVFSLQQRSEPDQNV